MDLRSEQSLLQSTSDGQVGWAIGLWYLLFFSVLLAVCLQIEGYRASSVYMEDALALSNLAAAVIDIEEYGRTGQVMIGNVYEAKARYEKALQENLGLNASWECANKAMISGPVRVDRFIVYNVTEEETISYVFDENGNLQIAGGPGRPTAPNGIPVEATGIYSEISYELEGLFHTRVSAHKGKLVDVCENGE